MKIPLKYIPRRLTRRDAARQRRNIIASRKAYRRGLYLPRPKVASYPHKPSSHVERAKTQFRVKSLTPSRILAKRTGCPLSVLRAIVRTGEGAYYSSGSRPNQTAHSWGIARLASALTGGPAAKVDAHLLKQCR